MVSDTPADRPLSGNALKTHRDGDRLLQLPNEEFLVSASHQLALITSLPRPRLQGPTRRRTSGTRIAGPGGRLVRRLCIESVKYNKIVHVIYTYVTYAYCNYAANLH